MIAESIVTDAVGAAMMASDAGATPVETTALATTATASPAEPPAPPKKEVGDEMRTPSDAISLCEPHARVTPSVPDCNRRKRTGS